MKENLQLVFKCWNKLTHKPLYKMSFNSRKSENILRKKSIFILFIGLAFSTFIEAQNFNIKFLSPSPDKISVVHDSVIVLFFQIRPIDTYELQVYNNLPNNVTLQSNKIKFENGIYRCDMPLKLGRNAIKFLAYPKERPSDLRLEFLEVYYTLPKENLTETVYKMDTLEVVKLDTFEIFKTDTFEVIKRDTVEIFKTDTSITLPSLTTAPKIILHRPHPLDDPMKDDYFIAHERQINLRFSVTPFDSSDIFENWVFDPTDPKSAKQTKQHGDTFFEQINLNKRENKVTLSVHNLTKDIQLEKSISVLFEPQNFSRKGRDFALFIAVEDYEEGWVKLQNPINDVQSIGKILKEKYGFETDYLYNPTGEEMEVIIRNYVQKKYSEHDQLLIFLSGHGAYDKLFENGYFAPRDANAFEQTRRTYYSYRELKDQIAKMGCNKILLMIDACYSGAFFDAPIGPQYKSNPRLEAIPKMERIFYEMEKKTFKALTSSDRQTATYDTWQGLSHSPFTEQILKVLRMPDRDGIVDLNDLENGIKGLGSIGQLPVLHSFAPLRETPGADFYFIQK